MPDMHPHDALQELLDGRLDPRLLADVERHLATCDECRRELDVLRWTKAQASGSNARHTVAPDLGARVLRALDETDAAAQASSDREATGVSKRARRTRAWRGWTLAGLAAAAAVLLAIWVANRGAGPTLPERVAADYRNYQNGQLRLAVEARDVAAIETYFRRVGIPFRTRVFDLRMMQYEALGGLAHQLGQRPSALFVYRGPDGRPLMCEMYVGRPAELPSPTERRVHQGIEFLVYRKDGLTLVFWLERDGSAMCVLAGEGDPQAVISLAFAKAAEL